MINKKLLILLFFGFINMTITTYTKASEHNTDKINMALNLIKIGCVTGESTEITVVGDGNINFMKKGASGTISFNKEEINGVIKGANQSIRAEENSEIRKCMQQYIPQILDSILETKVSKRMNADDYYYLDKQKIPVDTPISILDGKPLLTISKIYESTRIVFIKILLEIPYREPYKFTLSVRSKHTKSSAEFEYRNIIYKVKVNQIDLQEQNAALSIIKYKQLR